MIIQPTFLNGVFEIENLSFQDHRGKFIKTYQANKFEESGLEFSIKENFYSVSKRGVLRGMHFQLPPHDHAKLVYVTQGEILDVAVDIRKGSSSFGSYYATYLSSDNARSMYMAKGFAHGFLTISELAVVVYSTNTLHVPESDAGIRWDSFGFDWGIEFPLISERDSSLLTIAALSLMYESLADKNES